MKNTIIKQLPGQITVRAKVEDDTVDMFVTHELEMEGYSLEFSVEAKANISKVVPATQFQPLEGGELENIDITVNDLIVWDNNGDELALSEEDQKEIIAELENSIILE